MGQTNSCYNPKTFTPGNAPLLSLGQWQMLQLYLVDAMNLPLTSTEMPYADILAIYTKLHAAAIAFHGNILPKAQTMGNQLFNYGQTASRTFNGVVQLMSDATPNKEAILQLLGNLQTTAGNYQTDATEIFTGIESFISETQQDVSDLTAAVTRETDKIGADKLQIQSLQSQYDSKYADKQQAQAQIVSDQNTIDSTKYYSWIPFVGTAVAVGEIIAKRNDIKSLLNRIDDDIGAMRGYQNDIQKVSVEIAHLTYAAKYNQHMADEINNALGGMQLIESAWKTIASEIGDVAGNIRKAAAAELKDQPCLASIMLTTAANEWQDIATDANSFTLNFYLQAKAA
jgi:hypothetical protein